MIRRIRAVLVGLWVWRLMWLGVLADLALALAVAALVVGLALLKAGVLP